MSSDEDEAKFRRNAKNSTDLQRMKVEKLMKNPEKPVFIPEKPKEKLPRAFNPPEIVRNIWGSSSGVGSGDFHLYRGIRRREFERQKYLDEKTAKESLDNEFLAKQEQQKREAEEVTSAKRAKRLKKREKEKRSKAKKAKLESGKERENDEMKENDNEKSNNEEVEDGKSDDDGTIGKELKDTTNEGEECAPNPDEGKEENN